jgi:uncharacterized protein (TIGR02391 family)
VYTKENFTEENFNKKLVKYVGNRIHNGHYSDAILAGTKCLTDVLREKGDVEGDGTQLVGQVLGGTAPKLQINSLQTTSEKDEQKGIEQLLRGYYMGVRNPRTHENMEDTEEFCIRIMILIDTMLQYLEREVQEFNVIKFTDRIYDPHFVASEEYAESLVAQVPGNKLIHAFKAAFDRRNESDIKDIKFAFNAMYQVMSEDDLSVATKHVGDALREAVENSEIADLFRLLKPSAWQLLQDDVKIRIENLVIDSCNKGRYDYYSGLEKGALGTWGNRFGRYFTRKRDLADALISCLTSDWYTQNYVGKKFMYSLPAIVSDDDQLEELAENLAYAALSNKAKIVRSELLEASANYPKKLKELLKVSVQERKQNDSSYADELLNAQS